MFGVSRRDPRYDSDQLDTDRMVEYIMSLYGHGRSRSNSPTQKSNNKTPKNSNNKRHRSPYDDDTTDVTDHSRGPTERRIGSSKERGFTVDMTEDDSDLSGVKPNTSIFKTDNGTKELTNTVNRLQTKLEIYEEILEGLSDQVAQKAPHLVKGASFSKSVKINHYEPLVDVYKQVLSENARLKSTDYKEPVQKSKSNHGAAISTVKVEDICTHLQTQIDVYVDLQNKLARTRVTHNPENNRSTTVEFGLLKDIEHMLDRIDQ